MKLIPLQIVASAAGRWSELDWHFIGWKPMPRFSLSRAQTFATTFIFFLSMAGLFAQAPSGQIQITKINKNFITNPQFTYTGAQQFVAGQRDRWLEVEVEFTSTAEFADDVTFRYYILVNGKLLTGEVTHTNIAAGRERRSVMYVPPQALIRVMGNRPIAPNSVQNIAVQAVQQGAVKDEQSIVRGAPQWYKSLPSLAGLVLNKNETPFAPLYWDRYEQIKPAR